MSRYFDDDKITLGKDKKGSEPCRHDPTLVCEIEGVRFYGASRSRLNEKTLAFMNADLLINLTGHDAVPPWQPAGQDRAAAMESASEVF